MKTNLRGIIGLCVFALCLWGIVLSTYAGRTQGETRMERLIPMQQSSCSSSTSSSHSE